MGDLSIKSLYNCKTGNSSILDVRSLVNDKDDSFDIRKIILAKEEKRKKLCDMYDKFYKRCLEKIEIAITHGKTDLLYHVPYKLNNFPQYNSYTCLDYIERRLKSQYMDTYIHNANIIFITWYYIEANIDNDK